MMPSLSLRVSQNLTLTPQLQQSIRLLQLSTQELQQEVEQMLDENPFLERDAEEAAAEPNTDADAGAAPAAAEPDTAAGTTDSATDAAAGSAERLSNDNDFDGDSAAGESLDFAAGKETGADAEAAAGDSAADWEEWGGDLPARSSHGDDEEETPASERSSEHVSLQDVLHRQALSLRLC